MLAKLNFLDGLSDCFKRQITFRGVREPIEVCSSVSMSDET